MYKPEFNDLIRPKELIKKYPDFKISVTGLGYLLHHDIINGKRDSRHTYISELSALKLHDWRFKTNYLKGNKELLDKINNGVSLKLEELAEIYNTLLYFYNNAEQFLQVKNSGAIFSVKLQENEKDTETELYDMTNPKSQKIFNKRLSYLKKILEFINENYTILNELLNNLYKRLL